MPDPIPAAHEPATPLEAPDDPVRAALVENLAARLQARAWTHGRLDRLAMLAPGTSTAIITGRRSPGLELIGRIAGALSCSVADLVTEPEEAVEVGDAPSEPAP